MSDPDIAGSAPSGSSSHRSGAAPRSDPLAGPRGGGTELDKLLPVVYLELQVLAHRRLELGGRGTLDTSALVHEAYLKLAGPAGARWSDRSHFFALASKAMRQILADRARARATAKRGGERRRVTLDEQMLSTISADDQAEAMLELDRALERLSALSPRLVQVVECRFFGGMRDEEIARALDVTDRTVRRDWEKARLLLAAMLR